MNPQPKVTMIDTQLLTQLAALQHPPAPFEPGEPQFWTDPHIARQMLKFHLDPDTEAASRRPETIDRMVAWMIDALGVSPGDRLLDLGCGPGLYARRFAERGLRVTGVDFSQNSLDYARAHDPASRYLCQNYCALDVDGPFDAVVLIYGDFCVLGPADRTALLGHVRRVLRPGGRFALDVTTPTRLTYPSGRTHWEAVDGPGFWKPGPHLVLTQEFIYPEAAIELHQYNVLEPDGRLTVYRNWFQHYTPETLSAVLDEAGFDVLGAYDDLAGAPRTADSEWLGVVAARR